MADYWSSIASESGRLILTLSLGVIPCQYRHKWYVAKY